MKCKGRSFFLSVRPNQNSRRHCSFSVCEVCELYVLEDPLGDFFPPGCFFFFSIPPLPLSYPRGDRFPQKYTSPRGANSGYYGSCRRTKKYDCSRVRRILQIWVVPSPAPDASDIEYLVRGTHSDYFTSSMVYFIFFYRPPPPLAREKHKATMQPVGTYNVHGVALSWRWVRDSTFAGGCRDRVPYIRASCALMT